MKTSLAKKLKFVVLAIGVMSISILSGCATSGTHEATEPMMAKLSNFKTVNLTVDSTLPDAKEELKTIQAQVSSALKSQFPVSAQASEQNTAGALGMKLEVVDFNAVGFASHLFLGGLGGADRVAVTGTLYDVSTGKKIGAFKSMGEAHLSGIVAGDTGTQRASAQLGKEILALIQANQ